MQTCACGVRVGVLATERVSMRGNEELEYLKTINVTVILKCQNNKFCDFLTHRDERYSLAYPRPPLPPLGRPKNK